MRFRGGYIFSKKNSRGPKGSRSVRFAKTIRNIRSRRKGSGKR